MRNNRTHFGSLVFWGLVMVALAAVTLLFPGPAPAIKLNESYDSGAARFDASNVTASASWRTTLGIPNHNLVAVDASGNASVTGGLQAGSDVRIPYGSSFGVSDSFTNRTFMGLSYSGTHDILSVEVPGAGPSHIVFKTATGNGAVSEKARLTSAGELLIATTTDNGAASLQTVGNTFLGLGGGETRIASSSDAGDYKLQVAGGIYATGSTSNINGMTVDTSGNASVTGSLAAGELLIATSTDAGPYVLQTVGNALINSAATNSTPLIDFAKKGVVMGTIGLSATGSLDITVGGGAPAIVIASDTKAVSIVGATQIGIGTDVLAGAQLTVVNGDFHLDGGGVTRDTTLYFRYQQTGAIIKSDSALRFQTNGASTRMSITVDGATQYASPSAGIPAPVVGGVYFNGSEGKLKKCNDGSNWVDL